MTLAPAIVIPTTWIERSNSDIKVIRRVLVEVIDLYQKEPGKLRTRMPDRPTYQPPKGKP